MSDNPDNLGPSIIDLDAQQEITLLVEQLGSRNLAQSATAEFALQKLGAAAIPRLADALVLLERLLCELENP